MRYAVLVLFLFTAACTTTSPAPFEQGASRYRFDVDVRPTEEAFSAAATVLDLDSKAFITTEPVAIRPGESVVATADDPATGARLTVRFELDDRATVASWSATLKSGERLIASRQAQTPLGAH